MGEVKLFKQAPFMALTEFVEDGGFKEAEEEDEEVEENDLFKSLLPLASGMGKGVEEGVVERIGGQFCKPMG